MSRSCWAWETLIAGRCPCWSMWWGGWRRGQQAEPLIPSNQLPLRFYRCWKWCGSQVSVRMILWCCGQRSACAFLFFFFALRWSGGPCRGRLWSSSALVIWDVRVDDVGTPHYLEVWIKASKRVLELHSLLSDYVSMQKAEGCNEGNSHPLSSAVCSFYQPRKKGLSLQGNGLACFQSYFMRSLKGRSVPKTLQVGQDFQWEYQECLVALASPPSSAATLSRGPIA